MKKILMKKIKYRMCLFLYLKHFEWYWVTDKILTFFSLYKNDNKILPKTKEKLRKEAREWYQKHKERFWKEARGKYQNVSVEEKEKRGKKTRERYQNFSEEQKHKLLDYMRNYYITHNK